MPPARFEPISGFDGFAADGNPAHVSVLPLYLVRKKITPLSPGAARLPHLPSLPQ